MSETLRHNVPLHAFLDAVITHRTGGIECFVQVPIFEQIHPLHMMGPHPGQVVSLQFKTDQIGVELFLTEP